MARPKSLLASMEITVAGRAHDCRFNEDHRIQKGCNRLTIKVDGDPHHYCLACARSFLLRDMERLKDILSQVNRLLPAG
jgi:hypothetical protein